jgi:hypothetical protein
MAGAAHHLVYFLRHGRQSRKNLVREDELSPNLKMAITTAFNDGLRHLISSAHGVMPEDAIVLNVIAALCVARKQLGFSDEQTRDEVVKAVNTNMTFSAKFGGKT